MSEYKWIYFMVEIIGDLLLSPDAGLLEKGRVYVGGMVNCFDQINFSDSFAIVMPEP